MWGGEDMHSIFFKYSYIDLPHFNALRKLCFAYALLMIC
jgi:hypothetical protein